MQPKIQEQIRKYTDYIFDRDTVPKDINGVKVNQKPTGKTRPDGSKVNATIVQQKKKYFGIKNLY